MPDHQAVGFGRTEGRRLAEQGSGVGDDWVLVGEGLG